MRLRLWSIYIACAIGLAACKAHLDDGNAISGSSVLEVLAPKVNMFTEPAGVEPGKIDFGWQLRSSDSHVNQTSYRIQVSDTPDFDNDLVWDSGEVSSEKSQHIKYDGPSLANAEDYFWQVEVWTNNSGSSKSPVAHFFTAPKTDDLKADWIGAISRENSHLPKGRKMHVPTFKKAKRDSIVNSVDSLACRSIMLRKEFPVKKSISSAKAYIVGLGHYKLKINGESIGNSEFAPLWTDYDKTVYYNIYDVTDQLKKGENAVGVLLGNGMYNVIGGRYSKFFVSFGPPTLFFQLKLIYDDGSEGRIISDGTWEYSKSPITFNTIFGGEDYDARLEQPGWDRPGFNGADWKSVVIQDAPRGELIPQQALPVRIDTTYEVKESLKINDTTYVLNMRQNLSGFPKIKAKGKRGQKIRIWVGEKLKEDGTISQGGSGKPYYYEYTFKGDGIEEWRPNFSYYGYQYVQLEGANYKDASVPGVPTVLDVQSLFVSNSAKESGSFSCSNEIFNKAHDLIDASMKSNFQSVFTDCPHREKLGWLEETHLNGPGLFYNFNLEGFVPKVMRDIADAQRENGLIPNIAPEYIIFGGDFTDSPEWGLAGVMLPWMYYEYYGDASLLRQYYPVMKKYIDYLSSTAKNHIVSHGLGDWYDYGEHAAGYSQNSPISLSATSHYYYGAKLVAKAAKMLGKTSDAEKYSRLEGEIKKAFNAKFYNEQEGSYGTGSQFSDAVPIFMGIVEPENKEKVLSSLLDTIRGNNYRLTTGDVGNRYLFQTLAENGQNEVMYKMQSHYDAPGYGFQIKFGLTTLTEQWDPRNGNSLNHFMMGQIEEWFYKSLAGIIPDEKNPGYKHFYLQPEIVGDMTYVKASYQSIYGEISSEWHKNEKEDIFKFSIPPNTSATVKLPVKKFAEISVNGEQLENYQIISGKTVFELGSGNFNIKAEL